MEKWKDIEGTSYSISDNGNVRSNKRVILRKNNIPHSVKSRILKPSTDKKGYLRVALSIIKS